MNEEDEKIKKIFDECIETFKEELPQELKGNKVGYFTDVATCTSSGKNPTRTLEVAVRLAPRGVRMNDRRGVPAFPATEKDGLFTVLSVDGFEIKPEDIEDINKGIEILRSNPEWSVGLFDYIVPLQGGNFGLLSVTKHFKVLL